MERFSRIRQMIGSDALDILHQSKVTLVGLGAVGGYVLEGLVRSGVGHLRLIDFDRVELSNFNRQILAVEENLGHLKSEAARDRVLSINPQCKVEIHSVFLDGDNIAELLKDYGNLVVDAIDSFQAKADLLHYAWNQKIPILSSMGAARKSNPLLLRRADLMDTQTCPLAKKLRLELRSRGTGRGIPVIYSSEKPSDFPPEKVQEGERAPLGSFPGVTAMFGLQLSQWAVERLMEGHGA